MTTLASPPTAKKHETGGSIGLLFAALMVTMLLASLSQMALSSALPTIVGELHGVQHMTWVITAYLLASTIVMPIYGKVSDLLGRRPVLLGAIVIFVAGSVIGGLAGDMTWLIIGRAVQGLGGGGLMILSQAALADVVPARERGKLSGIMGSVFAVSSVAGPLLGGWFTEGPGWRWAFWINLPLGVLAAVAVAALLRLPTPAKSARLRLDYLGMALMSLGTTVIVLIATWGGSTYAWLSPQILGLAVAGLVIIGLFVLVESRAAEPVIPLRLFTDRNFNLSTIAGLLTSVAMFGVVGYMPTYFQMATGASATAAGLLMIPMMGTLLLASIGSGAIVSRTGKYKLIPIVGTVILAVGLILLGTVTVDTPVAVICLYIGVVGTGIGASLQLLIVVVQDSFPHQLVGTATAAHNYFRQIGGSLGSAVVGSVFASRLLTLLAERMPQGGAMPGDGARSLTPALVNSLPEVIRQPIVTSYNEALMPIFIVMLPLAVIGVLALCFMKEKPLSTRIEDIPAETPRDVREEMTVAG